MDLLTQTKYLIKQTGLKPDKLKGQNFCIDQSVIQKMIEVSEVNGQDTVLEVGPGFGFLTMALVEKAKRVVAVELEQKLIKPLKQLEKVHQNLQVIEDDVLRVTNYQLPITSYKIIANLPYSITSVFLKKFLTAEYQPKSMTLLVQKEVAERICAKPGQMSLLAISVQLYGRPKIIQTIGPASFWPSPRVESAILQINDIQPYQFSAQAPEKVFWQVARIGFSSKRKQLHNNLKNSLHLSADQIDKILKLSGIYKETRAQELKIEDWLRLAQFYQEISN